jgi:hypothetical protein
MTQRSLKWKFDHTAALGRLGMNLDLSLNHGLVGIAFFGHA